MNNLGNPYWIGFAIMTVVIIAMLGSKEKNIQRAAILWVIHVALSWIVYWLTGGWAELRLGLFFGTPWGINLDKEVHFWGQILFVVVLVHSLFSIILGSVDNDFWKSLNDSRFSLRWWLLVEVYFLFLGSWLGAVLGAVIVLCIGLVLLVCWFVSDGPLQNIVNVVRWMMGKE